MKEEMWEFFYNTIGCYGNGNVTFYCRPGARRTLAQPGAAAAVVCSYVDDDDPGTLSQSHTLL